MADTNPATTLAKLLRDWHVPGNQHPEAVRGIKSSERRDFWRSQAQAVALAQRVDNILRGLAAADQNVSMYSKSMVAWYEGVFSYSAPWQHTTSAGRPLVEEARLENLEGLGLFLDAHGRVEISENDVTSLRTALDEARQLAAEDTNLDPEARRYIWSLIVEALATLDEIDTFGTAPVRSILVELGGVANLQADIDEGAQDQPTAGRWRNLAGMFVAGFTGAGGGRGFEAIEQISQKAIEGLS